RWRQFRLNPEVVDVGFLDALAAGCDLVMVRRPVDQRGIGAFPAIDRRIVVTRVGEDRVVAGTREVAVRAYPAQQLGFARRAVEDVARGRSLEVLDVEQRVEGPAGAIGRSTGTRTARVAGADPGLDRRFELGPGGIVAFAAAAAVDHVAVADRVGEEEVVAGA